MPRRDKEARTEITSGVTDVWYEPVGDKYDHSLPYYIVGGYPRCGTSMMMAVLEAGGIPAKYDKKLVEKLKKANENREDNKGYQPYPVGGREMPREIKWHNIHTGEFKVGELSMPRQTIKRELRGTCVKIVNTYVKDFPELKPAKVVYMTRCWEEARASAKSTFKNRDPDFLVTPDKGKFDAGNDWFLNYWNMKADTEVVVVDYSDILADPVAACDRLLRFGFPIRVDLAAVVIDPKWYRHVKGENC